MQCATALQTESHLFLCQVANAQVTMKVNMQDFNPCRLEDNGGK